MIALLLCTLVFIGFFQSGFAIFKEKLGQDDWQRQNLGLPRSVIFHPDASKNRMYVGSKNNVVAALKVTTGHTAWRQVFPEHEHLESLILHEKILLTITDSAIRALYASNGAVLWDAGIYNSNVNNNMHLDIRMRHLQRNISIGKSQCKKTINKGIVVPTDLTGDDFPEWIVYAGNKVICYDGRNGNELWQYNVETNDAALSNKLFAGLSLHISSDGSKLFMSYQQKAASLEYIQLDIKTGKEIKKHSIVNDYVNESNWQWINSRIAVGVANVKGTVFAYFVDITSAQPTATEVSLDSVISAKDVQVMVAALKSKKLWVSDLRRSSSSSSDAKEENTFVIRNTDKEWVVDLNVAKKVARLAHTAEQSQWDSSATVVADKDEKHVIRIAGDKRSFAHVTSVSTPTKAHPYASTIVMDFIGTDGKKIKNVTFQTGESGTVKSVYMRQIGVHPEHQRFQAIVVTADHSFYMVEGDDVVWRRDEALARVEQVRWIDLLHRSELDKRALGASSTDHVHHSYPSFSKRFVPELKQLVDEVRTGISSFSITEAKFLLVKYFPLLENMLSGSTTTTSGSDEDSESTQLRSITNVQCFGKECHHALMQDVILADSDVRVADEYGLNKLILTVAQSGRIYAIESDNGNVLWTRFLVDKEGGSLIKGKVYVHVVDADNAFIVASATGEKVEVLTMNPQTGRIKTQRSIDKCASIVSVVVISQDTVALIDANKQVFVHPEKPQTHETYKKLW